MPEKNGVSDSYEDKNVSMWNFKQHFHDIFYRPHNRFAAIDGLRAFAIIWVIAFHCLFGVSKLLNQEQLQLFLNHYPLLLNGFWQGDKGVDMFFVVSGYLIGIIVFSELQKTNAIDYTHFYLRRLYRILPVFWFALLIYFFTDVEKHSRELISNLLFINNFFPYQDDIIPVGWSLVIEMQFYLLAPLLLYWIYHKNKVVTSLIALFLLTTLARYLILSKNIHLVDIPFYQYLFGTADGRDLWNAIYVNLYTRAEPIICGLFLAWIYRYKKEQAQAWLQQKARHSGLILISGIVLMSVVTFIPLQNPQSFFYQGNFSQYYFWFLVLHHTLFSIGFTLIVFQLLFGQQHFNGLKKFLSLKIWYPVSQMVFPIYLFHFPFVLIAAIIVFGTTNPDMVTMVSLWQVLAMMLLTLILTMLFVIPVHVFIEKPFMVIRK